MEPRDPPTIDTAALIKVAHKETRQRLLREVSDPSGPPAEVVVDDDPVVEDLADAIARREHYVLLKVRFETLYLEYLRLLRVLDDEKNRIMARFFNDELDAVLTSLTRIAEDTLVKSRSFDVEIQHYQRTVDSVTPQLTRIAIMTRDRLEDEARQRWEEQQAYTNDSPWNQVETVDDDDVRAALVHEYKDAYSKAELIGIDDALNRSFVQLLLDALRTHADALEDIKRTLRSERALSDVYVDTRVMASSIKRPIPYSVRGAEALCALLDAIRETGETD